MPSASAKRMKEELEGYGVAPQNIRIFGQEKPKPDLQEYLTLNALRQKKQAAPDGVAEHQGKPILYFVDDDRLRDDQKTPQNSLFDNESADLPVIFRQL